MREGKPCKTFQLLRGDIEGVLNILIKSPEEVNADLGDKPKEIKHNPLQVAIKSGHLDIATYSLDRGADLNFIEESTANPFCQPVIQQPVEELHLTAGAWSNVGMAMKCIRLRKRRSSHVLRKCWNLGQISLWRIVMGETLLQTILIETKGSSAIFYYWKQKKQG